MTPPEVTVSLSEIEQRIEKATKGDWIPVLVRGWEFGADVITEEDPDPDGTPYVIAGEIRGVDAAFIAAVDPPTVSALCEALRIAVEGLDAGAQIKCRAVRNGFGPCPTEYKDRANWCAPCHSVAALAAVRELLPIEEATDD